MSRAHNWPPLKLLDGASPPPKVRACRATGSLATCPGSRHLLRFLVHANEVLSCCNCFCVRISCLFKYHLPVVARVTHQSYTHQRDVLLKVHLPARDLYACHGDLALWLFFFLCNMRSHLIFMTTIFVYWCYFTCGALRAVSFFPYGGNVSEILPCLCVCVKACVKQEIIIWESCYQWHGAKNRLHLQGPFELSAFNLSYAAIIVVRKQKKLRKLHCYKADGSKISVQGAVFKRTITLLALPTDLGEDQWHCQCVL